jgi:hypothetical protein
LMRNTNQVRSILVRTFGAKHVDALLMHYAAAIEKYVIRDWEGVAVKTGKFIESVTKALVIFCGKTISDPRHFKAGNELRQLESLNSSAFPDEVRIVIPKGCIFAYEIVNNRGGRHDAHDINANEMDAKVVLPIISWVLAEMVRFCSKSADTKVATKLIDELTNKAYPYFEQIDGRSYVNVTGLKPGEIALLLLYFLYPKGINRPDLVDLVRRHGPSNDAAKVAVHRLKYLVDDAAGLWKLRGIGRQKAENLLRVMSRD